MNLDLHEHNKDDIIVSERYHQEVHHYSGERSFHEYYDINIDTTIHKDNRETPLPQEIAKKTKPSILPVESTRVAQNFWKPGLTKLKEIIIWNSTNQFL
jgi:hypothetical protein